MEKEKQTKKRIILSGGGTGGSAIPLLTVAKELEKKHDNLSFLFIGTNSGPEKKLVSSYKLNNSSIYFKAIPAGKWRRYFSIKNFIDIFSIIFAFFISLKIIAKEKPSLILSAGGFVSVPLAWAAFFKRVPVIIHQQDVRAGLANKLMARTAKLITVTFEKSLLDYGKKAIWTGNPFPTSPSDDKNKIIKEKYNLSDKLTLLVLGGATGSQVINDYFFDLAPSLSKKMQIVHVTGKDKKPDDKRNEVLEGISDYKMRELVSSSDILSLLSVSDLVVSRCGLATLTEICALKKVSILIPIPNSHQEDNALIFSKNNAALVLNQEELTTDSLHKEIENLLEDENRRNEIKNNLDKVIKRGASEKIAKLVIDLIK